MGRKAAALSSSSQKLPSSSAAPNNNEQSIFGSVADILPFPITDNNNNNGLFAAAGSSSSSSSSSSVNKKKRSSAELNAGEDGEKVKRPPRVDYREPEAKARLQAAIDGVTMQLDGDPNAFHKLVTEIAKTYGLPYNTLRDNFLRSKGIEPRAHRESEKKRLLGPISVHVAEILGKALPSEQLLVPIASYMSSSSSSSSSAAEGSAGNHEGREGSNDNDDRFDGGRVNGGGGGVAGFPVDDAPPSRKPHKQ